MQIVVLTESEWRGVGRLVRRTVERASEVGRWGLVSFEVNRLFRHRVGSLDRRLGRWAY